jgi:D-alanyl-D-alanine carboxypeptidase
MTKHIKTKNLFLKNAHNLTLMAFLLLHLLASGQTVEKELQHVLDSVYAANPASVGIMVHVESPKHGLSWSGASGYSAKDAKTKLKPDQPALIASNTKTFVSATILRLVEQKKLTVDQPIHTLLSERTSTLFQEGGYNVNTIAVKHLLSHTSGIRDFAADAYTDFINANKTYRWTRDEQLELAVRAGPPLGSAGFTFSYADVNYLLLSEIVEHITQKPFYTAMRELLGYQQLGLSTTWMPTLEEKPAKAKALAHQYWRAYDWDSYDIDVSADLYGGGGIACSTQDLARFLYQLLNYDIVEDTTTLNLIYSVVPTQDSTPSYYFFGLAEYNFKSHIGYGHEGFWGTIVVYFPEFETSVAIYVLERDDKGLMQLMLDRIVKILTKLN